MSAAFVLDLKTGWMAFEDTDDIQPNALLGHLVAIMNEVSGIHNFRAFLAQQEESYRQFIKRAQKITSLTFEVRPTNPRDRGFPGGCDAGDRGSGERSSGGL